MAPLSKVSAAAIARLRTYQPPPATYHTLPLSRRAAVLLLLFGDRNGDLRVVLTLRASDMSSYAGQVSLPGGKADALSETPFDTARREASEEIGLPRKRIPPPFQVEHLCELPTHLAITELGVRPCIAYLHTGEEQGSQSEVEDKLIPQLNAKEVAAIFSAPFQKFLSEGKGEEKKWYRGVWNRWNDSNWRMHNFYIPKAQQVRGQDVKDDSYRVYGLTASILVNAARIAFAEQPGFPCQEEIGEEDMIRRLVTMGRLPEKKEKGSMLKREDLSAASKPSKTKI